MIAQSVEHRTFNPLVLGSSPSHPTRKLSEIKQKAQPYRLRFLFLRCVASVLGYARIYAAMATPQNPAAHASDSITAALPISFARPSNGCHSFETASATASIALLSSSTIKTKKSEAISRNVWSKESPSQNAHGTRTAMSSNSCRNAASWIKADLKPENEYRAALKMRLTPPELLNAVGGSWLDMELSSVSACDTPVRTGFRQSQYLDGALKLAEQASIFYKAHGRASEPSLAAGLPDAILIKA